MRAEKSRRTVQKIYDDFAAGDVQAVLDVMSADVDWESLGLEDLPFGGTYRGADGVRRFFDIVAESEEMLEFVAEAFVVEGDTVVALGYERVHVKSTGKVFRSPWAQVWTLRDGKVTKFRAYMDTGAMRAAYVPS